MFNMNTKIPTINTLNIIKNYDNQFTRKITILQDKFLDLADLVLTTTWYTFNSQFYQQLVALKWEYQQWEYLQPHQKFICRFMNKLQYI